MKQLILASFLAAVTLFSTSYWAFAQDLTIYAGVEGGGYDARAQDIAKRLSQRQIATTVVNRAGSDDITLQACRDPQSLWIAQKDALWLREQEGCYLVDLGVYGEEVAVILFPPGSRLTKLSHLEARHRVLVDRVGSGSELSWRTMVKIEREFGRSNSWSAATTVSEAVARAQSLAQRGEIDAVFLVRTTGSPDLKRLLDQGWILGEMYDRDITDLKYGNRPLYESRRVEINDSNNRRFRNYAYVVPSFIGTTEQVERSNPQMFDELLRALN
jgi:TRAP-type uncharacterized transport system substrate-binding protein